MSSSQVTVKPKAVCASSVLYTAHARLSRKTEMTIEPHPPTTMQTAYEQFKKHPNGYEG